MVPEARLQWHVGGREPRTRLFRAVLKKCLRQRDHDQFGGTVFSAAPAGSAQHAPLRIVATQMNRTPR